MRVLVTVFLVLLAFSAVSAKGYARKSLAGPPEEFEHHRIPNPKEVVNTEYSFTQYIYLERDGTDESPFFHSTLAVPVDGEGEFIFTFASPFAQKSKLTMKNPLGEDVDLTNAGTKDAFPLGVGTSIPLTTYSIPKSVVGIYELSVMVADLTKDEVKKIEDHFGPDALVTVLNNDNIAIESHLNTYEISAGKKLGVSARVVPKKSSSKRAAQNNIKIASAKLSMMMPNGQDVVVPMRDDGVHPDLLANDGIYGAEVDLSANGNYIMMPILSGFINVDAEEPTTEFMRSSQHLVSVSDAQIDFTGEATWAKKLEERSFIRIFVNAKKAPSTLRAYTEVYGVVGKETVPVAWLGGLVDVVDNYIQLELDHNWLKRVGVSGNLILRNTYLADVHTSFPVASFPTDIKVDNSLSIPYLRMWHASAQNIPITKEMRTGINPLLKNRTKTLADGAKKGLVLVPGYCASENPWERNAVDFTNAYFFDEKNLNIPNDEYAKKVMDFADEQGLDSFGLIGHSQGGIVALHIHNYYFTGLEQATGPRLIQSVGTPWLGSTAAGDAADLGSVFGIGCGANSDLTRDGAVNWLSGIRMDARQDVYYYTTTYKKGYIFGDYCSLAMNAILQWPNDAVTELEYAILKGGNNMGNKEEWCHTTDMAYPAQYDDHVRNKEMNMQAAR